MTSPHHPNHSSQRQFYRGGQGGLIVVLLSSLPLGSTSTASSCPRPCKPTSPSSGGQLGNDKDVGSMEGKGGGTKHDTITSPPPLCWSQCHLAHHLPTSIVLFLSSSLLPPPHPHPLPMAGCCVLGRWGRTLLTSSSPLNCLVAIITITPVICLLSLLPPKASPPPILLSLLLPMASPPPQPQQLKTILSRRTRGADCCIVVITASWIGVYGVVPSPPLQTYQLEQWRAAQQQQGHWICGRRGRRRKA
jgi:hypothetical protein